MKKVLALVILAVLAFLAITTAVDNNLLPEYGEVSIENRVSNAYVNADKGSDLETGSANIVTGIVTGYRSFDTLGEVTVLFISALGVSLILGSSSKLAKREKSGFILRVGSKLILPIIIIVGFYVITHGHLSPGGGFQGGAMIASAMLLMTLSDSEIIPNIKGFKILEGVAGTAYIVIGLIGFATTTYFLNNFMETGVVGELFSAGFIPVVYLFVGLKVGAELTSVITDFFKEEANI